MEIITSSAEETIKVARKFADTLSGGETILLFGELGAGKTTFTKGIALSFGIDDTVTSPTFTIVREYEGERLNLYHMDMYRLEGELSELGLEDYFGRKDGVSVVEWNCYPELDGKIIKVYISYAENGGRKIRIENE